MKFSKLDDGSYETHVPSSDPRKPPYRVIIEKDAEKAGGISMICGCLGWEHRQKCRHVTLVLAELKRLASERHAVSK